MRSRILFVVLLLLLSISIAVQVFAWSTTGSGEGGTYTRYVSGCVTIVLRPHDADYDLFVFYSTNRYYSEASHTEEWWWLYNHADEKSVRGGSAVDSVQLCYNGNIKIVVKRFSGSGSYRLDVWGGTIGAGSSSSSSSSGGGVVTVTIPVTRTTVVTRTITVTTPYTTTFTTTRTITMWSPLVTVITVRETSIATQTVREMNMGMVVAVGVAAASLGALLALVFARRR